MIFNFLKKEINIFIKYFVINILNMQFYFQIGQKYKLKIFQINFY